MRHCIDDSELRIAYVRASGPGGQKVNKAATKAQLRWHVGRSDAFTDAQKRKIREAAGNRLTQDDELVIASEAHRSQGRNKEEAVERLCALIERALAPVKKRRPTKPPRAAKERRISEKKKTGEKKRLRKPPRAE